MSGTRPDADAVRLHPTLVTAERPNSDGQVVTGRGARVTGALFLLFGLILVYGGEHVWRANAS